ncbi:MAG TPA: SHOCT domain-containing protein [Solirubrobacterales bacterium]
MGLGEGGLLANRAAMRMRTRQQYRTMSRMQRRRSYVQEKMGARQDFQPAGGEEAPVEEAPPQVASAPAATAGDYTVELEKLAKLRDEGVISPEDFEAKKKQLLGL